MCTLPMCDFFGCRLWNSEFLCVYNILKWKDCTKWSITSIKIVQCLDYIMHRRLVRRIFFALHLYYVVIITAIYYDCIIIIYNNGIIGACINVKPLSGSFSFPLSTYSCTLFILGTSLSVSTSDLLLIFISRRLLHLHKI